MKKFLKFSLYGLIYAIIILFLAVMFITTTKAEILKPNNGIEPFQVVKIQLRGLMNNNTPSKDNGIKQAWEFAHPNNQKNTGPLNRFISMLNGDSYKMLLNHLEHDVKELKVIDSIAFYQVTVMDEGKNYYEFNWQVEKYTKEGPLKDCWLTTMVSAPKPLGSSI